LATAPASDSCNNTQNRSIWMALKGKTPTEEIKALPSDIEVFHVERLTVPGLDAERCIVWMRLNAV
jgi:16S rRNA (guanine527-N7)-methyltransferase